MAKTTKETLQIEEVSPLKWPDGWPRTLVNDRETRAGWKKSVREYREAVGLELQRMGATAVRITRNISDLERRDPGVAVWFSLKAQEDSSWQIGLHLDNPIPSLDEIDAAYRKLAQKHHPDAVANGSGGDVEVFQKLSDYRKQARAWVLGEQGAKLEHSIPCDKFTEVRLNLAAIRLALAAFRQLERVGIPAILERVMDRAFKTALPQNASKETKA